MRQEAKSPGAGKQKILFMQSTHRINQIQNKLKQDWVIHISNKLKGKNPVIFHSISHQRAITTDYSLNAMMTLPLPSRGFSASLAQPWKLSHLPPFCISPHTQFFPFQMLWVLTSALSLFLLSFDFCQLQQKKKIHRPIYLIRCSWHIMLHLNVQLSSPWSSYPKRSEVWAKSSQSRNPNPHEEGPLGSCFQFLHR